VIIRPELSDEEYTKDEKGRHFSNFHYNRILKNGETEPAMVGVFRKLITVYCL
jgi:hypothetical protein